MNWKIAIRPPTARKSNRGRVPSDKCFGFYKLLKLKEGRARALTSALAGDWDNSVTLESESISVNDGVAASEC